MAGARAHGTFANVPPSAACEQGDPDEREHHRFGHRRVWDGESGFQREEIVSVGVELVDEKRLRPEGAVAYRYDVCAEVPNLRQITRQRHNYEVAEDPRRIIRLKQERGEPARHLRIR